MKICIIGPVRPFRSGIARHTTRIASELADREGVSVNAVSFSCLYPRWLYPGESDTDKNASASTAFKTSFEINSLNPFNWKVVAKRIIADKPDLAIIPAWTFFVAPCLSAIAGRLRAHMIPVQTVVHNVADHEGAAWKAAMLRSQLRQSSKCITHTQQLASEVRQAIPGMDVSVAAHPIYDDYPKAKGRLEKRAGIELLMFGLVRPYKGVDIALRALAQSRRRDIRLSIVGEFWNGLSETQDLIRKLQLCDQVDLIPRHVSDEEAAEYFARSDAMLLPYRSASASGVLALAQHYCKPVIASDLPAFSASIQDGKTGWGFPAGDVSGLGQLLRDRVTRTATNTIADHLKRSETGPRWSTFVDTLLENAHGSL